MEIDYTIECRKKQHPSYGGGGYYFAELAAWVEAFGAFYVLRNLFWRDAASFMGTGEEKAGVQAVAFLLVESRLSAIGTCRRSIG